MGRRRSRIGLNGRLCGRGAGCDSDRKQAEKYGNREKRRALTKHLIIPWKLRWPGVMFTLREIFYNEKLRGCFATAFRGRASEKTCSTT
jgi:hypothetical protein